MIQVFIKHQRKTAGAMLAMLLLFVLALGSATCLVAVGADMSVSEQQANKDHSCCKQTQAPARDESCKQHCASNGEMPVADNDMTVQAVVTLPIGKLAEVVTLLPPTPYTRPADTGFLLDRHPEQNRVLTI